MGKRTPEDPDLTDITHDSEVEQLDVTNDKNNTSLENSHNAESESNVDVASNRSYLRCSVM